MPQYDWRCLVCDASNLAKSDICKLCAAPVRLSGKEIESRRAEWGSAGDIQSNHTFKLGLASKLALFLVADVVVFFVFMGLATSSGGNAIGAGLVGILLLVPAPFLVLAWIAVVAHSLLKGK